MPDRALAMALILALAVLLNLVSLAIMLGYKGGGLDLSVMEAMFLIYLKNVLLLGFAFLMAVLPLSNIICVVCTFFVFCIGSVKTYFLTTLDNSLTPSLVILHKIILSFFPNFRIFDVVENITLGNKIPTEHLVNCLLHFTGVSILVYGLAFYFFNKKEL